MTELETSIQELFNNIKDHSQVGAGYFCAQYHPRERRVLVAISDFGVGIPFNIKLLLPGLSDVEALRKALQEGYSTKSTPRNRGAGLAFFQNNVVGHFSGSLIICSGCAEYHNSVDMYEPKFSTFPNMYPGTLVVASVSGRSLFNEPEAEDFVW